MLNLKTFLLSIIIFSNVFFAKEFDELRKKGLTLQQIVDYFLKRDEETIAESRLVAKLKAEARVDSRVYLKREYSKEKWGVSLTYTFR